MEKLNIAIIVLVVLVVCAALFVFFGNAKTQTSTGTTAITTVSQAQAVANGDAQGPFSSYIIYSGNKFVSPEISGMAVTNISYSTINSSLLSYDSNDNFADLVNNTVIQFSYTSVQSGYNMTLETLLYTNPQSASQEYQTVLSEYQSIPNTSVTQSPVFLGSNTTSYLVQTAPPSGQGLGHYLLIAQRGSSYVNVNYIAPANSTSLGTVEAAALAGYNYTIGGAYLKSG